MLAAAACRDERKQSEPAAPPAAKDAAGAVDAAPAARPPLPDAERAALAGRILAAAGREDGFRVVAIDPTARAAPVTLTAPGASYYPAPGPRPLAIATVDQGELHLEQIVLLGDAPADARPVGPRAGKVRSPTAAGDVIVFESDEHSVRDLYRLDLGGKGKVTRLTDTPAGNFEPALSPDGATIAFTSSRDGDAEIYTMPAAGGDATRLTAFHRDDFEPRWSPDGGSIAFLSDREGSARIYVMRADGAGLRPLHDGTPAGEEASHAWSPDGARIAFTVATRDGASEIWIADVARGKASRLSPAGARDEVPTWSPDGRHLAFVSTRDRRIDVWIARADGSAESRATDTPEEEWIPRWIP